jgi:hypothetical protein
MMMKEMMNGRLRIIMLSEKVSGSANVLGLYSHSGFFGYHVALVYGLRLKVCDH